ncbi:MULTISPECIES: GNAT family N-acetyltransferase [Mesorhizobium]|uniref:GNAT family N-acetyltransferase n=2 Tax=Mesorhizobium TaxID=68287 RepID=A0ABU5AL82_9HYPH|nr:MULTISPECIES: GNAT family N-acetyltransferase [Mesorhizobium]MDX8538044.1 GNAT family N-acetyltransferase [Mesorhizobium abyssinicae]RUW77446.1 GNAT family N-acetyltransferase [Mesorhizobium sp. M4B.F.Ca.ET.049.02.1.2]RVD21096.1 GNAT family N-acetyltransferase [Mesorhizobium sp. M4B.F.Ca.ET.017.02.2.1]TGV25855.1 GNAT family N-acetyltransferase [Mesorhizobium sp. M4B.F.Ca.ET.143.01.1.1]
MLATVRRYEAAGFRAWPAAAVHYDGTWVVRLTAGHPAKRLNSVNPLDPGDTQHIAERIGRASRRFDAYGRPLTFRISPLSGPVLSKHLDGEGWSRFDESLVMRLPLADARLDTAMDQIPLKDISRFIGASLKVSGSDVSLRPGLSEIIGAIQPEAGLFALEDGNEPLATLICVHDGDLAGLFEIATDRSVRNQGHGRNLILSALKWARLRGAREAWLQVEAGNAPALGLYRSLGFEEVYRYHYRRPPGA